MSASESTTARSAAAACRAGTARPSSTSPLAREATWWRNGDAQPQTLGLSMNRSCSTDYMTHGHGSTPTLRTLWQPVQLVLLARLLSLSILLFLKLLNFQGRQRVCSCNLSLNMSPFMPATSACTDAFQLPPSSAFLLMRARRIARHHRTVCC